MGSLASSLNLSMSPWLFNFPSLISLSCISIIWEQHKMVKIKKDQTTRGIYSNTFPRTNFSDFMLTINNKLFFCPYLIFVFHFTFQHPFPPITKWNITVSVACPSIRCTLTPYDIGHCTRSILIPLVSCPFFPITIPVDCLPLAHLSLCSTGIYSIPFFLSHS